MSKRRGGRSKRVENIQAEKNIGMKVAVSRARMAGDSSRSMQYPIRPPVIPAGVAPAGKTPPVMAQDSTAYSVLADVYPGGGFPGYPYLSQLATRPEYRAFASTMSTELTREWIEFTSKQDDDNDTSDKIKAIEDEFKRLNVRGVIQKAAEHDCYFGRGQIFITIDGADDDTPLILDKRTIPTGSFSRLSPVEAIWTTPSAYNTIDPSAPDFYKPNGWYMLGREVHAARLMTIITRPLPDMLKPAFNFGGMSLSQLAEPYVENWLRTRQSVSDLINNFSITVLKTAMDQVLQGDDDGSSLMDRADLFTLHRSNKGLMLLDKDREELGNVITPLSGLHELQAQSQEHMCSVSRTPAVILTGISHSGLNASSEGEIRVFYDWISAQQESFWREPIETILKLTQLSLFGEIDPDIGFTFVPLYQMTPAEEAAIRLQDSQTDAAYVGAGVLDPSEVRDKLAKDPLSGYQGLDTSIEIVPPMGQEDPLEEFEEKAKSGIAEDRGDFDESKVKRDGGKFATQEGGGKKETSGGEPQKPDEKFEAAIAGKTESDQEAFRAAKADGVAIPPAWTGVSYYGKGGENGIIAQGTDAKGRRQRQEVPEFRERMIKEKHERIAKNLSPRMEEITNSLRDEAKAGDEEAKVLYLVTQTGFRIGGAGDGKAKEQAFGASTLRSEHVKVDGDTVTFDFPGKKGVRQQHAVTDPVIANMMRGVKPGEPVFKTRDTKVREKWKSHGGEKVHDIRSHVATETAREALSRLVPPKPKNKKEFDTLQKMVAEEAAKKLGNRPAESLKTYINHDVFEVAK